MIKTLILIIILLALFYFLIHIETFISSDIDYKNIMNFLDLEDENKIQDFINWFLSLDNDDLESLMKNEINEKINKINFTKTIDIIIKFINNTYKLNLNTVNITNLFDELDDQINSSTKLASEADTLIDDQIIPELKKLFINLKEKKSTKRPTTLKINNIECGDFVSQLNKLGTGFKSLVPLVGQSSIQCPTQLTTQATQIKCEDGGDIKIQISELQNGKTFRAVDDEEYIYILSFKSNQIRYIKQLHSSLDTGGIETIVDVLNEYSLNEYSLDNNITIITLVWLSNNYDSCNEKLPTKITFQGTILKKDDKFTILSDNVNKSLTLSGTCNYNDYSIEDGHTQILPDGCSRAPTTTSTFPPTTSTFPPTTSTIFNVNSGIIQYPPTTSTNFNVNAGFIQYPPQHIPSGVLSTTI